MLEPVINLLSQKMGINVEGTIVIVALLLATALCMLMKGFGSFLAYTEFGNNQVKSFFGICLYKSADFVSIMSFPVILFVIKALV